jgi:hypothetical protein
MYPDRPTAAQIVAQEQVKQALRLISEARKELTIWEFERYIRENVRDLGSHGFLCSIGEAILKAATIQHEKTAALIDHKETIQS